MFDDIFAEKYRPQQLSDIVGQDEITIRLKQYVNRKSIQNLLFSGPAGTGKTTSAICIVKELFGNRWLQNFKELNASDERGINVIRDKVKDYCSTQSLGDIPFKVILLDEADSLTTDAQNALRRIMERYSSACKFILSCNYSNKIIEPIQSRCAMFRFKKISDKDIMKRVLDICRLENIEKIEPPALDAICYVSEGDLRKAINILEIASLVVKDNIITLDSIYKSSGVVHPDIIIDFIKRGLLQDKSAFDIIDTMLFELGLSYEDILKAMFRETLTLNIEDRMKVDLIDYIGECDFRISEGANERLQLRWLVAKMMKLGAV